MRETSTQIEVAERVALNVTIYEADALLEGRARTVVCLHGWPNSGRVYRTLADSLLLADPRFRLICPSFRGYGGSDHPADGYACVRLAEDILRLAMAMNLTDFALIGHSMGGKIAQIVAARRPAELKTLVLLCPVPLIAAPAPEERKAAQKALYGDEGRLREMLSGMAFRPLPPESLNLMVEDAMRCSRQAFEGWIEPMREEDFSADLARVHTPSLIVHGAKDPLRSEETLRENVADKIAGSQFIALPNVGHLPHVEDPAVTATVITDFLDRRPA